MKYALIALILTLVICQNAFAEERCRGHVSITIISNNDLHGHQEGVNVVNNDSKSIIVTVKTIYQLQNMPSTLEDIFLKPGEYHFLGIVGPKVAAYHVEKCRYSE